MDSQTIKVLIAILGGLIPSLVWLFFWLREDDEHPEPKPKGLILITFIIGMASVILIVPLEQMARGNGHDSPTLTVVWAALEELIKYAAVAVIALKSRGIREPVDYPIYFMVAALGFASLENTLFLIHPLTVNDTTVSLLTTGSLRFLGANLLHSASSGIVGIALGLSYYKGWLEQKIHLVLGLLTAVTLHSVFNFFIMSKDQNLFAIYGFLWVATIIIMLLFEKLRRMKGEAMLGPKVIAQLEPEMN